MIRVCVALAWLLPCAALADVPQPPPASCPRGAVGQSTRSASYCTPTECARCGSDQRCSPEPIALCVVTADVPVPPPPGIEGETTSTRVRYAVGPCVGGTCAAEGARCERAPRCLPATDPVFDQGLCSASPGRTPRSPALAVALALGLAIARRR